MTSLGPAWVRFSFQADGQFTSRIQLAYARIRERGRYCAQDGVVVFDRGSGITRWPYRVRDARLELAEAADESHTYTRRGRPLMPAPARVQTARDKAR